MNIKSMLEFLPWYSGESTNSLYSSWIRPGLSLSRLYADVDTIVYERQTITANDNLKDPFMMICV